MYYSYTPKGVCPIKIEFDIDGDVIKNIRFTGGCNGNLKAVSKLVNGWTVDQIESALRAGVQRHPYGIMNHSNDTRIITEFACHFSFT